MLNRLWVVIGQTGSGKSTFIGSLPKDIKWVKASTTRPMRPGEVDGHEYWFWQQSHFDEMEQSGYLQAVTRYNTLLGGEPTHVAYGIHAAQLRGECAVITDWSGYLELRDAYGDKIVKCLYMYCSESELKERAMQRDDYDEKEFTRRVNWDSTLKPSFIDKWVTEFPILILDGTNEERLEVFNQYRHEMK